MEGGERGRRRKAEKVIEKAYKVDGRWREGKKKEGGESDREGV